jgi:LemA protein
VIPIVVVILIVVVLLLWFVALYNRFVRMRNRVDNAWAQVDVQLRRRYDLIPNLVETVKGYASHERETFERVTQARAGAAGARTVEEQAQAENMLTAALRQLFAVAEAYPELRANENFQQLQAQLEQTEGQIATSRQIYNDTVLMYNNGIQQFPGMIIAGPLGFVPRVYFEPDPASREPAQVDFRDMPGREVPGGEPPAAAPPTTPPPAPPPPST